MVLYIGISLDDKKIYSGGNEEKIYEFYFLAMQHHALIFGLWVLFRKICSADIFSFSFILCINDAHEAEIFFGSNFHLNWVERDFSITHQLHTSQMVTIFTVLFSIEMPCLGK